MNWRKWIKQLLPEYLPATILHRDPCIFSAYWFDFYQHRQGFAELLRSFPKSTWLFQLGWENESAAQMERLLLELAEARAMMDANFIFMCNTEKELELFQAAGLEAYWIAQNVFLDERHYRILPKVKKEFDALYIARVTPFKRHELATGIASLSLIGNYHQKEAAYYQQIRKALPQAHWQLAVSASRIPNEINRARTGLCLSEVEGAMFVSAEYLLCGVPAVNTPNIGGRDVLFPPEFVRTVDATPEAVAAGVQELVAAPPDPVAVRSGILALMQPYRERYAALLTDLCARAGKKKEFRFEWDTPHCFHKLGLRCGMLPWQRSRCSFRYPRKKAE